MASYAESRISGGFRYFVDKDGVTRRQWPAVKEVRRISKVRLERLHTLLKLFKAGKSIQEISTETGWKKDKIYHEMYYLKSHGLLDPEFRNPFSVWTNNIAKVVEKGKE